MALDSGIRNRTVALAIDIKNRIVALDSGIRNRRVALVIVIRNSTVALAGGIRNRTMALAAGIRNRRVDLAIGIRNRTAALSGGIRNRTVALDSGIRNVLKIILVVHRMDNRSNNKQLAKLSNYNTESQLIDHRIFQSLNRLFCKEPAFDRTC